MPKTFKFEAIGDAGFSAEFHANDPAAHIILESISAYCAGDPCRISINEEVVFEGEAQNRDSQVLLSRLLGTFPYQPIN